MQGILVGSGGFIGPVLLRGMEGFGANSRLHTAKVPRISADPPVVVEIVDTREKIDAFLPVVDQAVDRKKHRIDQPGHR